MRYLLLSVLLLPACELLGPAVAVASDPVILAAIPRVVEKAVAGEWLGAGYALASLAAVAAGRWFHGRVKKSGPGEIIGGAA